MRWDYTVSALCAAPPAAVWAVLLDGRRWSFWNPGVEWLWFEGEAEPGTLATIKFKRVRQTALVIEEALSPQRFALALTVGPVARMRVTWTLAAQGTGTRIEAAVAVRGVAAGLLLKRPAKRVADALAGHLERLGARACEPNEKNARSE
jgi:hypothetical protein